MTTFESIALEIKKGVAIITLNRPKEYNALNKASKEELLKAIRTLEKDESVSAIVITGAGKAFCTGQDLNDRQVLPGDHPVDLGDTLLHEWLPLIKAITNSSKIMISAINGVSAGAGLSLALSCDMAIAHPSAKFVGAFSKLSLAPDAGLTYLFARGLGKVKAMEFFLLGETLLATDLHQALMINSLDDNPLEKAISMGEKLHELPAMTLKMIKHNIRQSLDAAYSDTLQMEVATQRYLGHRPEYKEGLTAFLEKRLPNYKKEQHALQ